MRPETQAGDQKYLTIGKQLSAATLYKFMQISCKARCALSVSLLIRAYLATESHCQDQQAAHGRISHLGISSRPIESMCPAPHMGSPTVNTIFLTKTLALGWHSAQGEDSIDSLLNEYISGQFGPLPKELAVCWENQRGKQMSMISNDYN